MAHQSPITSFVAFVTGSAVSITEFIRAGSVLVQFGGSVLAVLGGYWIYVYWRTKAEIQAYELKRAKQDWEDSQANRGG